ncbi:hypothetical protein ACJ5NV_19975 [Loktanella agnita]|uniref:hypothetical protein n=1 Tax=Loktanella agnita TaxID=287097 RepID=UPI00398A3945
MKSLTCIAGIIALSACTPPLEITQPNATAGVVSTVDRARITSYRTTEIRTYTMQDDAQVEVGNQVCSLRSEEVAAQVITPIRVDIPRFVQSGNFENRGRPMPLQISCEGNGLQGAETVFAQDKQVSTATNAGIGGAILSTVVSAAVASSTPWRFPEAVKVTVRPY